MKLANFVHRVLVLFLELCGLLGDRRVPHVQLVQLIKVQPASPRISLTTAASPVSGKLQTKLILAAASLLGQLHLTLPAVASAAATEIYACNKNPG